MTWWTSWRVRPEADFSLARLTSGKRVLTRPTYNGVSDPFPF